MNPAERERIKERLAVFVNSLYFAVQEEVDKDEHALLEFQESFEETMWATMLLMDEWFPGFLTYAGDQLKSRAHISHREGVNRHGSQGKPSHPTDPNV